MIHAQGMSEVLPVGPVAVTANADSTGVVDCRGYDYLTLNVNISSAASTTNVPTTLKLSEGDTTSAYTDILAFTGGTALSTAVGWVWPTPCSTACQTFVRLHVDLHKRMRYIQATMRHTTNSILATISGNLSRAGQMPITAAMAGAQKLVIG
jgi:hypothetical protein